MLLQRSGLRFCVAVLFSCLWSGCYPGTIDSASQTDLVATFHAKSADFRANHTFAMPDSIVDLGVAAGGTSTLVHTYDAQILAQIQQHFEAMGYTRVNPATTKPDAVVLVSAVTVDNYEAFTPYPWWEWWSWWPGWDGYWGYDATSTTYWPWAPVVVTSYSTGSLFIMLLDPDVAPPAAGQVTSIWAAAINGLLEGTNEEILARLNNNIAQSFVQSPYLATQ